MANEKEKKVIALNPEDQERVDQLAMSNHESDLRLADVGPRVVDTRRLKVLVREGRHLGFNRTIPDEILDQLSSDGNHIIAPLMYHYYANGEPVAEHIRSQVYLKLRFANQPEMAMLDLPEKALTKLRRARPESKRRPDPHWQEVLQMQADLIEQVKRNPPAIGVTGRDDGKGGNYMEVPDYLRPYDEAVGPLPVSAVNAHDPYFMNEDAVTLVEFAASSMVSHVLGRDDMLTPTGFLVLERPFFVDVPTFGETPIRAFTWRPTEEGVGLVAFFDLWHDDAPADEINAATLASYRARLWPAMHWEWPWGETVDGVLTWVNATDDARDCLLELRKFIMSFWLLSQQRVTLVSGQKPVRGLRRQAERQGMPTTINVITLRRAANRNYEGGDPQEVEWTHRWIVSGHWRRLQREEGIKLSWVSPYVKGPEDKPLIVKEKFYKFER